MKKYLIIGLLFIPFFAKADTQVFGFMNGNFYDVNGNQLAICFMDQTCLKADNSTTTLASFLGLSTSTPQSITIVTGNPLPPPPPQIVYVPTYLPAPVQSPPPIISNAPVLLPPYTEDQLASKLGVWKNQGVDGISKIFYLNFQCSSYNPVSAVCDGSGDGSNQITFQFNGQTVGDCSQDSCGRDANGNSITGLTPNTDYTYTITYKEDGREDSVFTKSFHTPAN